MNKKLITISPSILTRSSCTQELQYTVLDRFQNPLKFNDTEFGSAGHLFIATMKRYGNEGIAIKACQEYFKRPMIVKTKKKYLTEQHLILVCLEYWNKYGANDDFVTLVQKDASCCACKGDGYTDIYDGGIINRTVCTRCSGIGKFDEPMVELKAYIPYYEDDKVVVMLSLVIDDICKMQGGAYAIRDYKFTSAGEPDKYFTEFEMSPQLMFYRLVIRLYAKMYPESIFYEINKLDTACFIQGIFLRGKDKTEFIRSDMKFFDQARLDEFEHLLQKKIMDIVALACGDIKPELQGIVNGACTSGFGCNYFNVCKTTDQLTRDFLLNNNFETKPFSPELL